MTFSPRAIEAAAEAMKLGVCQYCRQPAVGAGGGVVDCNCPYRVWDEPTDKERAQIALTAALAVDGVALVPVEPTAEMFCAAVPFPAHLVHERDDPAYTKRMEAATLADRLHARQIWLDMIAAASDREERR